MKSRLIAVVALACALGPGLSLAHAEDEKKSEGEKPAPKAEEKAGAEKTEAPRKDEKSVDSAGTEDKKQAGDLYTRAMAEFDKDQLEPALAGFRESYSHVKSPNSHFMIARTLARLGRNAEAYAELDLVIAEADGLGDRYADTARAAREKREEIRPRVGILTIRAEGMPKGTRFTVAGEPFDPVRLGKPIAVLPGETRVTATPPGGAEQAFAKSVQAGSSEVLDVDLRAKESAEPEEPTFHPRYLVEASAHVVGETLDPPGKATRGAGAGGRVALEIAHTGVLGGTDSLAVVAGFDWIGTSTDPHYWVPLALQWNVWMIQDLSLFIEPGVALLVGAGTHASPALDVGLRYRVWKKVSATGRIGIPGATIGVSILL